MKILPFLHMQNTITAVFIKKINTKPVCLFFPPKKLLIILTVQCSRCFFPIIETLFTRSQTLIAKHVADLHTPHHYVATCVMSAVVAGVVGGAGNS
jgi:hypothetical protein